MSMLGDADMFDDVPLKRDEGRNLAKVADGTYLSFGWKAVRSRSPLTSSTCFFGNAQSASGSHLAWSLLLASAKDVDGRNGPF